MFSYLFINYKHKKIKIARPRYEIELLVSTPWRR